jgi:hypothetical protein
VGAIEASGKTVAFASLSRPYVRGRWAVKPALGHRQMAGLISVMRSGFHADESSLMPDEFDFDLGTAGAGARREYERRRANRERRTRESHPHIGNLLLKLQDAPEHEKAWATGAAGEKALAAFLLKRCPEVIVLHDRRIPRSRANIDHLAVAPSGVYVIDAKVYKGKIEVRKPFFGDEQLVIAGRSKPKLVEGLQRQVEAVQSALDSAGQQVPVHGCFCFINPKGQAGGSGIPLLRTLNINGFSLYYPRKLAKRLNGPGELTQDRIEVVSESLARLFPSA